MALKLAIEIHTKASEDDDALKRALSTYKEGQLHASFGRRAIGNTWDFSDKIEVMMMWLGLKNCMKGLKHDTAQARKTTVRKKCDQVC